MAYYDIPKVLEIIRNYHHNINYIRDMSRDYASVGVSQYGIEASLPKGNNITDAVANEALRQIEMTGYFADIMTDIKYIQDRWDRVTDEKEAQVLNLRLSGLSASEIGQVIGCSERNVNKILRQVAQTIISYPQ